MGYSRRGFWDDSCGPLPEVDIMGGETIAPYGGSSASTRRLSPRESELLEHRGADADSPLQIKLLLASTKGHDVIL